MATSDISEKKNPELQQEPFSSEQLALSAKLAFRRSVRREMGRIGITLDPSDAWSLTAKDTGTANSGDATTDGVIDNNRTRIEELEAMLKDVLTNLT